MTIQDKPQQNHGRAGPIQKRGVFCAEEGGSREVVLTRRPLQNGGLRLTAVSQFLLARAAGLAGFLRESP